MEAWTCPHFRNQPWVEISASSDRNGVVSVRHITSKKAEVYRTQPNTHRNPLLNGQVNRNARIVRVNLSRCMQRGSRNGQEELNNRKELTTTNPRRHFSSLALIRICRMDATLYPSSSVGYHDEYGP